MTLEQLKTRADELGIKYGANISAVTLGERIAQHLEEALPKPTSATPAMNEIAQIRADALRLVRVTVTPMDVLKRDYAGEFLSLKNRILAIQRFIPFGIVTHIEAALLEELKGKMFRMTISETRESNPQSKLVKAYAIDVLEPLDEEQIASLAKSQKARNSIN